MQNIKIQTLWNLCSELKEKRESLIHQWRHSQNEIGQTQDLLSSELSSLRQSNQALSEDLYTLNQQLAAYWESKQGAASSADSAGNLEGLETLVGLEAQYSDVLTRAYPLKQTQFLLKYDIFQAENQTFLQALGELEGPFDEFFQQILQWGESAQKAKVNLAENSALDLEFIDNLSQEIYEVELILSDFEARTQELQAQWEEEPEDESEDTEALQAALNEKISELETLQGVYGTVKNEFLQMQADHKELFSNCEQLTELAQHLQSEMSGLVVAEPETSVPESIETASDIDKDAIKEAVLDKSRKQIVSVLKSRFTKVPRRIHNLLKKVDALTKIDKLFDKALGCETMEDFQNKIESIID